MIPALLLLPALAYANGASETFTRTSLLLILMITLADVCGFLFERLGMPEILGEIYAGILLGNLVLVGIDFNLFIKMVTKSRNCRKYLPYFCHIYFSLTHYL